MTITYGDIMIPSGDQHFIDNLAEKLDVDYYALDVSIGDNNKHKSASITNQLIRGIYEEHITTLEVPEKIKEKLIENIHTNSVASCIFEELNNYPKKYHKQLELLF